MSACLYKTVTKSDINLTKLLFWNILITPSIGIFFFKGLGLENSNHLHIKTTNLANMCVCCEVKLTLPSGHILPPQHVSCAHRQQRQRCSDSVRVPNPPHTTPNTHRFDVLCHISASSPYLEKIETDRNHNRQESEREIFDTWVNIRLEWAVQFSAHQDRWAFIGLSN